MANLSELQEAIAEVRAGRGFTNDPVRIYALLNEEIGEIAGELKKAWSTNYGPQDRDKLADELADCLVALCALASAHDIDLSAAVESKFFGKDGERHWPSATNPVKDDASEAGSSAG